MFLEIKGSHIISLPFQGIKRISDLLSFEGNAVLSHFKDEFDNNFLFYWVDFHEGSNRWLVCKVSKEKLYYYLNSSASLKELISDSSENTFLFIVDSNPKGEFVEGYIINPSDLPDEYMPDNENYFDYDFPSNYEDFFSEFSYINLLRENALYFTLKAKNNRFGDTVSAKDAVDFLNNVNKSYNEYTEYSFFETFKNTTADLKKLGKTFSSLKDNKALRICDMSFNSFHVALCADVLTRNAEMDEAFNDWNKSVVENFKNEVIDNDFSSNDDAKSIAEKFPDVQLRKRIFEPIIKIIESSNVELKVNNHTNSFKRTYKTIQKTPREIIIPQPTIEELIEDKFPKRKIIQVYIEIPQDEKVTDLSKKTIKENLLFSQETNEYPIRIEKIEYGGMIFELIHPLLLNAILNENGNYHLDFYTLNIHVQSADKDELLPLFSEKFYTLYTTISSQQPDGELAAEMQKLISKIITIEDNDLPF